jgi:hypothetical protein
MTLAECIDQYESQHPAAAVLSPLGEATMAARPLVALLPDIDPKDRQDILGQLVATAPTGPEGHGFSLWVSHARTTDPEA